MQPIEYYAELLGLVRRSPYILDANVTYASGAESECVVRGVLQLVGNLRLHIAEYVITNPSIDLRKYRYHLQGEDGDMICRWDNASHHPEIDSHPHHLHRPGNLVKESEVRTLRDVLRILPLFMES